MSKTMAPPKKVCTTIDEVIQELDLIIGQCIETNNRAGYFTVLYYCVTCRVKEGIVKNEFEDGQRMERLDVLFANRYLEAWHLWREGKPTTASWGVAFRNAKLSQGIVLQHLLLGINAHINLDLGIAAVETMQGSNLLHIQRDFNSINAILGSIIDKVQDNISKVSPLMSLLDLYSKNHDEMLVQFSINIARKGAWCFAEDLHMKSGQMYKQCIADRDLEISKLANSIASPSGNFFRWTLKAIRASEWRTPAETIQLLKIL